MGMCRPTYPGDALNAVKRGPQAGGKPPLLRELSKKISDLLENDTGVQALIQSKMKLAPPYEPKDLDSLLDDPDVQKMIQDKTKTVYLDLIKRSYF